MIYYRHLVILNSHRAIKEAFVQRGEDFADRQVTPSLILAGLVDGTLLFCLQPTDFDNTFYCLSDSVLLSVSPLCFSSFLPFFLTRFTSL